MVMRVVVGLAERNVFERKLLFLEPVRRQLKRRKDEKRGKKKGWTPCKQYIRDPSTFYFP